MADDVELVRSRTDIVQLVGQRVLLRKAGKSWKGLCPFHDDKNPSMQVDPLTGRYRCWSCGAKGDAFDWVMNTENVEFGEALRILAAQAGVQLQGRKGEPKEREAVDAAMGVAQSFFRASLAESDEARAYLDSRGIDDATAAEWGIGYAPPTGDRLAHTLQKAGCRLALAETLFLVAKDPSGGYYDRFRGRVMFPIRDERGRLVAFGGRALGEAQPKYINSGDTPIFRKGRVLYGMDRARQAMAKSGRAVLAEGYLDVIALHRAGVAEAVAPLGTALGNEHAKLLRRWAGKAVLVFDGDAAGLKASARSIEVLEAEGLDVRVARMPHGTDPDTMLACEGADALQATVRGAGSVLEFRIAVARLGRGADDPAFWQEAVAALAGSADRLERAAQIERLAMEYPGTTDLAAARTALHQMVDTEARSRRKGGSRRGDGAAGASPTAPLRALEAVPILALADESLRPLAWPLVAEPDTFYSARARKLASALRETFGEDGPKGAVAEWLPAIQEDDARETLEDLFLSEHGQFGPIEAGSVNEAAHRLRHRREVRGRHGLHELALVDETALQELSAKLQRSSGRGI